MLNINWGVRLKNPVFWAQVICAIVLPLIVGVGAQWEDMTSWIKLGDTIISGLQNPVVVVSMIASLWACITDPTTSGTSDSESTLVRDYLKNNVKHSEESTENL